MSAATIGLRCLRTMPVHGCVSRIACPSAIVRPRLTWQARTFSIHATRRAPEYTGASKQSIGRIQPVRIPAHLATPGQSQPVEVIDESDLVDEDSIGPPPRPGLFTLLWPVAFVTGLSAGAFLLAAHQTNIDSDRRLREMKESGLRVSIGNWFNRDESAQGMAVDRALLSLRAQEVKNSLKATLKDLKEAPEFIANVGLTITERWGKMSEAHRTTAALIGIQAAVFAAWWISPLRGVMRRHFLDWPASGRAHTMFTAVFSHQSPLHFLFNNVAFWSFGPPVLAAFFLNIPRATDPIPTSTPRYEFLAFFVAAGVLSSLGSQLWTTLRLLPRAIKRNGGVVPRMAPSLGASGAIYATVVYFSQQFPDSKLQLIFLPFVQFNSQQAVMGLIAFDVANLLLRFVRLDSAAHLAGALVGWLYYQYGHEMFKRVRLELRRITTTVSTA